MPPTYQAMMCCLRGVIIADIASQGGLYNYRGEIPAAPDRTLAAGDFVTDGTWRELDLSDIVPADACCIMCYVRVEDNVTNDLLFRRVGGVGTEACISSLTPGRPVALTFPVNAAGSAIIEYNAANAVWTLIELTVLGWFRPPT